MIEYQNIRIVQVELTTRCQAQCPGCERNIFGLEEIPNLPDYDMSLDQFATIFTDDFLRQLDHIMFCGNLGDSAIAKDFLPIINYIRTVNPNLHMRLSTNGSMRSADWWKQLANVAQGHLDVWFALDGLEDTHEIYRRGTSWHKIIENATAYIQGGGPAYWQFIPFEHNQHQIRDCIKLSKQLGFSGVKIPQFVRGTNAPSVYKDGRVIWIKESNLKPVKDIFEQPAANASWEDARQEIYNRAKQMQEGTEPPQPVSPVFLEAWPKEYQTNLYCITKEAGIIFLAANGEVYPCCYTGSFPRDIIGLPDVKKLINGVHNNALEVGLETAIQWFYKVEQTWKHSTIEQGLLAPCVNNCLHKRSYTVSLNS